MVREMRFFKGLQNFRKEKLTLMPETLSCAHGVWSLVKNIPSLLVVKLSIEKKVCAFKWCLVWSQKYTKSFDG